MTETTPLDVAVVILSTAPDPETGVKLARTLVEERLAACVSRLPGTRSIYHWKGGIEESEEELLLIKTHARLAPELTRRLGEIHPYEVPEILVLPVAAGHRGYLDWIKAETLEVER